jgi:hypothetical protein
VHVEERNCELQSNQCSKLKLIWQLYNLCVYVCARVCVCVYIYEVVVFFFSVHTVDAADLVCAHYVGVLDHFRQHRISL